ncbi:protein YneF [Enterobacter asburiae]|uniref:diguanylate cyclase n=1 Tax=Enterobacter asburiae TaxID=61645 RepID=A0A376F877_ENTAS|nr:protein YneF [Enterobacter asburiae]
MKRRTGTRVFLTVMLLDIDYFKSINDNYGHECGDRVLASFARQVQQVVGEDGMVARMAGKSSPWWSIQATRSTVLNWLNVSEPPLPAILLHGVTRRSI